MEKLRVGRSMECLPFLVLCASILFFLRNAKAGDSVTPTLSLANGQTLVSAGGRFELGFFHAGNSQNCYLGIWYKELSIIVGGVAWVANRDNPLKHTDGVLNISDEGKLILVSRKGGIVWSSNSSKRKKENLVVAQLLDTGNLVVKEQNDNNPNNYLWQSFDYPCDTLLPGMKLGWNFKTGLNRFLSSWKSTEDPSPGDKRFGIDAHGVPQLVLWEGENVLSRVGYWNGIRFSGFPEMNPNTLFRYNFFSNEEEVYFSLEFNNYSTVGNQLALNQSGLPVFYVWNDRNHNWLPNNVGPIDQCQYYDLCGAYSSCNISNSPVICQCLEGFRPKSLEDWNSMNWTSGCVRRTPFDCGKGEGFRKLMGLKLPDTRNSVLNITMNIAECEEECLKKCSCTAYATANIREGSGCLLWFGNLIDIRTFHDNGQEIYLKMAASELDSVNGGFNKRRHVIFIVTFVPLLLGMFLLGLIMFVWRRRNEKKKGKENIKEQSKELELPVLDFDTISAATENFSSSNKIGEGGFGPVYKGKLLDGQEIAVKRLSKSSDQGLNEFKNEVILISKLQHRNLVRLIGCCIQGEEKMLIYEYMPNKSLDSFIFDQRRSSVLDWKKRYDIICGIARGLLYLHQDSRLRIIHRDLKSSNILLDNEMNPKISDFGLARSFGGSQTEANTNRVVGTYGYMSPEYAVDGHFSVKSDVFSFGVIILEIVSGKKNRGFYHPNHYHNLLGHAWRLWNEDDALELMDATICRNSFTLSQVLRCIKVGLLCVQQRPDDRPSMSSVLSMLGSATTKLPQPKYPGFFIERNLEEANSASRMKESCTANIVTITTLEGR